MFKTHDFLKTDEVHSGFTEHGTSADSQQRHVASKGICFSLKSI